MALYAIGDLHLSLGADKPMDIFGGSWSNYVNKIKDGFLTLTQNDTCVICGDVSWGMSLEESLEDFKFLDSLPGKKIILKGNHDYWWSTIAKASAFFEKYGITSVDILNNNSFSIMCAAGSGSAAEGGSVAVCGTRGWFYEEESNRWHEAQASHDKKIMAREIGRLEASLAAAIGFEEKICFLHYPPVFKNYLCREIIEVMRNHGVKSCWYGHIHGLGQQYAVTGQFEGIEYHMVSADFVSFTPVKVC